MTKYQTQRIMCWRILLEEYSANFQYKKGTENIVADALSCISTKQNERKKFEKPSEQDKETTLCKQHDLFKTLIEFPNELLKINELLLNFPDLICRDINHFILMSIMRNL